MATETASCPSDPTSTTISFSSPLPLIPPISFAMVASGVYRSGCPMPLNFPFLTGLNLKSIIYLADQDLPPELSAWTTEHNVKVWHFRVQNVKIPGKVLTDGDGDGDGDGEDGNGNGDEDEIEGGRENLLHVHIDSTPTLPPPSAAVAEVESPTNPKSKKDKDKMDKVENDPTSITQGLQLLLDRRNFPVLIHSNKGKHRSGVLVACMRKLLMNWVFSSVKAEYNHFAGEKGKVDLDFIEQFTSTLEYDPRWAPPWLKFSAEDGELVELVMD